MNGFSGGPRLIDRLVTPDDDLLDLLVHKASFGIAIVDSVGCVVRVNGALRRMVAANCGLSAGSAILDVFAPPRQSEARDELRPVLMGTRSQTTFISMVPGTDGVFEHTVDVSVVGLREADGAVSGAILHLSDISVQTRLEAQLAHGQKLQAVGQFTSAIAHDFNNLLMAICGAADEALLRGTLDAESEADLQQIRTSGERGASLVRHLLAFGKPQPQQSQVLAVNDVVVALSRLLVRLLGPAIRLNVITAEAAPQIWVDPVSLDQVLVNLVVNARNAMPNGGSVSLTAAELTVADEVDWDGTVMLPGRYVSLSVEDTGVGIAPDVLPHIFNPFFTTRGEQGGSGLGLSNVKAIVHRCHGFVTVASEVARGTRISIYLPRYAGGAATEAYDGPAPEGSVSSDVPKPAAGPSGQAGRCEPKLRHASRTILFVEDDDAVRALAIRALTAKGWTVVSAVSAEAAMARIGEDDRLARALCLVITDVALPGMDGLALVRLVRRSRPGLQAMLVSGYSESSLQAARQEDVHILTKPYTMAAMAAAAQVHALGETAVMQNNGELAPGS